MGLQSFDQLEERVTELVEQCLKLKNENGKIRETIER